MSTIDVDGVVNDAVTKHRLVRTDPGGKAHRVDGFLLCECGQKIKANDRPATVWVEEDLLLRHRLYIAVTEATALIAAQQAVKSSERHGIRPGLIVTTDPETEEEIGRFK